MALQNTTTCLLIFTAPRQSLFKWKSRLLGLIYPSAFSFQISYTCLRLLTRNKIYYYKSHLCKVESNSFNPSNSTPELLNWPLASCNKLEKPSSSELCNGLQQRWRGTVYTLCGHHLQHCRYLALSWKKEAWGGRVPQ